MKITLAWVASIVLFIELLDTTLLYTCVVPIAHDFGVNSSQISLAIISYTVGTYILVPASAWLANKYNRLMIIIITLIAFAIFSMVCGLSSHLYIFSIFRFLQGMAISISSSVTLITLLSLCTPTDIVKTMGLINIPALFGTAIGPFFGAVLSYYLSWRVAFIINVPFCLILIGVLLFIRSAASFQNQLQSSKTELDWIGLILISSSLVMISLGFEQLSHSFNILNIFIIVIGIIIGSFYVSNWIQKQNKVKTFIIDLNVFKNIEFMFGILVNIFSRAAMCGLPILLSIMLQQVYGQTLIEAGLYIALIAVAGIIAKFSSSFITKLGVRKSSIVFAILTAISIASLSSLNFWIERQILWIPCFCFGYTMSLLYTSMNSVMYITLNSTQIPNASNIGKIIQQFSIGLGVVFAVGGFQLLLSLYNIDISPKNISLVTHVYSTICYYLTSVMMLNITIAIPFKIYCRKHV